MARRLHLALVTALFASAFQPAAGQETDLSRLLSEGFQIITATVDEYDHYLWLRKDNMVFLCKFIEDNDIKTLSFEYCLEVQAKK